MTSPDPLDLTSDLVAEIDHYTRGVKRARAEYAAHPIVRRNLLPRTCSKCGAEHYNYHSHKATCANCRRKARKGTKR